MSPFKDPEWPTSSSWNGSDTGCWTPCHDCCGGMQHVGVASEQGERCITWQVVSPVAGKFYHKTAVPTSIRLLMCVRLSLWIWSLMVSYVVCFPNGSLRYADSIAIGSILEGSNLRISNYVGWSWILISAGFIQLCLSSIRAMQRDPRRMERLQADMQLRPKMYLDCSKKLKVSQACLVVWKLNVWFHDRADQMSGLVFVVHGFFP